MEGRITCEHIDTIWAAAQLKHCSKTIHDLLPGLVKHLAAPPALHLYTLLFNMEPKEHTEQVKYNLKLFKLITEIIIYRHYFWLRP